MSTFAHGRERTEEEEEEEGGFNQYAKKVKGVGGTPSGAFRGYQTRKTLFPNGGE